MEGHSSERAAGMAITNAARFFGLAVSKSTLLALHPYRASEAVHNQVQT